MVKIKRALTLVLALAMILVSLPAKAVFASGNYSGNVKFIGQWTSESSKKEDSERAFTDGSEKIGTPLPNSGLLKGLGKIFLGWSDKPSVNGWIQDGARIFSTEDEIQAAFPDGLSDESSLYGVYFSLNDQETPLPGNNIGLGLSLLGGVGKIKFNDNNVRIDKGVEPDDILPQTTVSTSNVDANGDTEVVDNYKKVDDEEEIHEIILNSEFEMQKNIQMLAYKNPIGSNQMLPVLSRNYESMKSGSGFSTSSKENIGNNAYTFVDLKVNIDPRFTVPDILYLEFDAYGWRPLYALNGESALNIVDPANDTDLGNTLTSFDTLVKNTDSKVSFGVKTNGAKDITIRVILRNGEAEKIKEADIVPTEGRTKAEEVLKNMTLKSLNSDEVKSLTGKTKAEVNKNVLKVSDAVAEELSNTYGESKISIKGTVEGIAIADLGSVGSGFFTIPLKSVQKINGVTNTISIGYTKEPTVSFVKNYGENTADDYKVGVVSVEKGKSIAQSSKEIPKDPTREGHVFKEWNTSSDGSGDVFTKDSTVSSDLTVYAIWEEVKYKVSYRFDGEVPANVETPKDDNEYSIGFKVVAKDVVAEDLPAEKDGLEGSWKFNGWDSKEKTIENSDIEFVGTWTFVEKDKGSVAYEFVSGTEGKTLPENLPALPDSSNEYIGTEVIKPETTYENISTSEGTWTFKGWNPEKLTVVAGENKFTGTWSFEPKKTNGGGSGGTTTPTIPDKNTPDVDRVDGKDRIETSIEISKKFFGKAKTVIVVRQDLFPDSMTATVLSKQLNAPILLTDTNILYENVKTEIKRLGASEVIIVGGPHSVSEKVRDELSLLDSDRIVERLSGDDRYQTSDKVARRVVGLTGKLKKAVIASGEVFPDALSVSSFAAKEGYPILLVKKNEVTKEVNTAFKDLDIVNTYVVGGEHTITKETESKLPGVLERMAGVDRYETSVAIAKSKFKDSNRAFMASGEVFSDALVIGPVGAKYNAPILLTPSQKPSKFVKDYISTSKVRRLTAVGGQRYVPDSIIDALLK